MTWTNSDGLTIDLHGTKQYMAGTVLTYGSHSELVVDLDFENLQGFDADASGNGTLDSFSGAQVYLPAGAYIKSATLVVETAFVGGTSYDIDLVTTAGGAIGSGEDKLFDLLATAEINADGEWRSSRAHGGTNSGNALDIAVTSPAQLQVVATGTFTAGKARMIVEYMVPTTQYQVTNYKGEGYSSPPYIFKVTNKHGNNDTIRHRTISTFKYEF